MSKMLKFSVPGLGGIMTGGQYKNYLNQQYTRSQQIMKEWKDLEKKIKQDHIKFEMSHIRWNKIFSIVICLCGLLLFCSTMLRWNFSNNIIGLPTDILTIANSAVQMIWGCIMYRRTKNRLRELFIDAI